ncbi:hypothetical protein [Deferrisoma camini]|uniref:hypothetical protein n=1 Tax=Deferrisoma camini TaxID=1035120 RepID=UPI00146E130A|nr:hypothetical protein [Deferrisoma camini]
MDYKYIVIYRFEGISPSNLDEDKPVYQDDERGINVILTADINRHCLLIDTGLACASLLLRGMFGGEKIQDLPIAIDAEVTKIQEKRVSTSKTGAYVVIIIDGRAELDIKENLHRETEHFRICFAAIDKELIRKQHRETINAIVASLAIATGPEYHAEKVASGIHFIDENGKPLFSYTFQGGRVREILSKPVSSDKECEINKVISLFISNPTLKTPVRLVTQSLETTQDNLRAFMSAWSALEILVNKIFPIYEEKFISAISDDHNSHGVGNFLERIKVVMKDKYRLTDKFSLIASFLSSEIADDIELFKRMKQLRDDIYHGKEFDEEDLPVEDVRKMAAKYLKDHMLTNKNG